MGRSFTGSGSSAGHRPLRGGSGPSALAVVLSTLAIGLAVLAFADGLVRFVPAFDGWPTPETSVRTYLDMSGEMNLWSWYTAGLLLLAGCGHLLAGALAGIAAGPWWQWLLTGSVLLALSLDEATGLHERLHPLGVRLGGGSGLTAAAWLVPGLVVAALVVVAFLTLHRRLPGRPGLLLLGGLAALLGAAFGLESVGNAVGEALGLDSAVYQLIMMAEELIESLGAIALLGAPLASVSLRRSGGSVTVGYIRPERATAGPAPAVAALTTR